MVTSWKIIVTSMDGMVTLRESVVAMVLGIIIKLFE